MEEPGTPRLVEFHAYAQSNRACCGTALHFTGMRNYLAHVHSRARLDQGDSFFAYISLIIEFKGMVVKLNEVECCPCKFHGIAYFYDFFLTFHCLVKSLQTLLRETSPMSWFKGLKDSVSSFYTSDF